MTTNRLHLRPLAIGTGRVRALAVSLLLVVIGLPVTAVQGSEPPIDSAPPAVIGDPAGSVQPTIQYEQAARPRGRPDPVHGRRPRDRAIRAACL